MDALRKLSSLGRNRDQKADTASSSPKIDSPAVESSKIPVEVGGNEASHSGLTPIRVRVSDEREGLGEEKEGDDAESVGSADSFDSALERMAASSITSFEPPSPVDSLGGQSQFEGGTLEGLTERGQEGNLYNEYDDDDDDDDEDDDEGEEDDESEESGSDGSSEYSSSASNTEDDLDTTDYEASSLRAMPGASLLREEDDGVQDEAGVEEKFEEAYEVAIDSASEELEDTDSSRRTIASESRGDPEAGVSSRDLIFASGRQVSRQKESTSSQAGTNDEEGFIVKAPVTESKYRVRRAATAEENMPEGLTLATEDVFEDSEDRDVQVELAEKIIEVAREHNVEGGEDETDSPVVKKELPRDVTRDRGVLASPAHLYTAVKAVDSELPALKSGSGDMDQAESNTRSSDRGGYSGDEGDSDADEEDDYDENDEDEDEGDDGDRGRRAQLELAGISGSGNEGVSRPSTGAAGPSLPILPKRPTRKSVPATATDTTGRTTQYPNASTQLASTTEANTNSEGIEIDETREKLQNIRVKFLRLAHRLGQSPQHQVVAQVLYRLGLAESLRGGRASNRTGAFSFDRANALAEEAEATHQEEELDFECTILVLGKTGVGKSATINSIFDERKSLTSAFSPSTKKVHEIVGTVHGIKVRVIDTPGLLPSIADQRHNEKIMADVKKHIKKSSPDIVLYFDRLDMQTRDFGDVPLLRSITDMFGAAVWFNAIVVLTHASSAPPDGPNGTALNYETFLAQRSHAVQQTIRQAAGDMRLSNPVALVENHPACRTNRAGQRVLPNGQIWKSQLLLLCFASKILAEANTLLKLQETATPGKPFGQRSRVPPLPYLLSSLLQSRAQLKMPNEQQEQSDESDDDDEDDEDGDEYDELPPFRPLSKEELEDLSKEQRQLYTEELADRERLFLKKQYREQIRKRREMKKRAAAMSEEPAQPDGEADDEAGQPASVPVPMPDMALPPSFDSDNPTHRYRYLETANQWLVRPVLETHGWDHDAGYDGFNVEKMFVVKDKIPASISGQVTKDKKEAQVNFEAAASLKHGEGKVTLTGFDIQTIGKDLAYTLRAETRFNNFRRNKTTAGLTCTVLNDTIAAGLKLEDRILIGKRIKMVVNGGVLTGKGDKAFGGSLEATLRGKEYPLSRTLSTLGLSVMDWHGDLAIGGNLQSQFMVGKTMMVGRANLNNRGSGQVSIRASSSEQLQMVLIGIVPILRSLINCRFGFGGQPPQEPPQVHLNR
ncbi:hypothetical protein M758_3G127000 [Ceratodon purpureus]|nr:hypothetical protein M758_3G127000 [Ceratodon purpureus]